MIRLSAEIFRFDPTTQFTSWWRSDVENTAVGGHPHSQHLFGFAFDLVANSSQEIADAVNGIGLIAVPEFDHLHIQLLPHGELERQGFFADTIEV
jgi:hypothetical protein